MSILLLASVRKYQPVLYPTAALQHIRVTGGLVAFTYHVGGAELEFGRQGCCAGPLDVLILIIRTLVLAAHNVDIVIPSSVAADAFQLV